METSLYLVGLIEANLIETSRERHYTMLLTQTSCITTLNSLQPHSWSGTERKPQVLRQSSAHFSCSPTGSTILSGLISTTVAVSTCEVVNVSFDSASKGITDTSCLSRAATDAQRSDTLEAESDNDQPASQTDFSLLTSSPTHTDSGTSAQSLVISNLKPSLHADDETLYLLHGNHIDLHTSGNGSHPNIASLSSGNAGSNGISKENNDGAFQSTAIGSTFLEWDTTTGGTRPGYFSRTQIGSGTTAGQETRQCIGLDTQTTHAISTFLSSSTATISIATTKKEPLLPNIDPNVALDGSGFSQKPSRQTLGTIFGSIVGGSIFAGCFFIVHRLCMRHCRNVRVQRQVAYNTIHVGRDPVRAEAPRLEISHFSTDS